MYLRFSSQLKTSYCVPFGPYFILAYSIVFSAHLPFSSSCLIFLLSTFFLPPPSLPTTRDALVLEVTEKEAREHFIHKLQEARRNAWFTSLNWYVHGLAKDNRA